MKLLGLTGGIASGKSTVGQLLREEGFPVIDADQVAREVVEPGTPALEEIFESFGHHLKREDGSLDRKALGQIVFGQPQKLKQLNQITHPRVAQRFQEKVAALAEQGEEVVIYEVPLLFETGLHQMMNGVILVSLEQEQQLARLMKREGLNQEDALARIKSQMPLAEKQKLADWIIDNSGDLDDLKHSITKLLPKLRP